MAFTAVGSPNASSRRRRPRLAKLAALAVLVLVASTLLPPGVSTAATEVGLGNADSFAVLGSSTVTNTGPTVVNGDLGVSPGLAVTGFDDPGGPGIVNGEVYAGASAAGPQADALTAYNALSEQDCDVTLPNQELGDLLLTPGVYCLTSTGQLTGALTLDAEGDPDAVFIFRIGTSLTTASGSSVEFTNDFPTCNVFWQADISATLGTGTAFVGTLITLNGAITADNGATVNGRLLAIGTAVTLDNNVITTPTCTFVDTTPIVIPPVVTTTTVDTASDDDTTTTTTTVDTDTPDDTTVDTVAVPLVGGPSVPSLTASPGSPTTPGSPGTPNRPALPYTGSNLVLAGVAMLALMMGSALILVASSRRTARSSSS